jgi:hypothetical protein
VSQSPPTSIPPPGAAPLWGSHSGSGARVPAGGPTPSGAPADGDRLEPLSRRLLQLAGLLSLLLLAVLANSFFHSGEDPLDFNPVAHAAEKAQNIPGGRFSFYIAYSSPASPASVTATGSGAYNAKTDRSRAVFELKAPTGALHAVEISDGDFEYLSGDLLEEELPPGKVWVRNKESESGGDEASLDPQDSLRILDSSGAVQMIGREPINGKMTRRYRGEIRMGEFIDLLRENDEDEAADAYEGIEALTPTGISAEAWLDRKNLLRRFRMVMPVPGEPGEPPLTVDMRMDIFDYGAEPAIQLPDPDTVFDGSLDEASASGSIT